MRLARALARSWSSPPLAVWLVGVATSLAVGCADAPGASPGGGGHGATAGGAGGGGAAPSSGAGGAGGADAAPASDAGGQGGAAPGPSIALGFNAHGQTQPKQQALCARHWLGALAPTQRAPVTIRVLGGTASQRYGSDTWSDGGGESGGIQEWVDMARELGVGLSFTVNGNESPAAQRAFYDRWVSAGAPLRFIELMNEYYLKKFATFGEPTWKCDDGCPEVTRKVTPEIYVNDILPSYLAAFADVDTRFYVILAPRKDAQSQPGDAPSVWNDTVLAFIEAHHTSLRLGATVHLYRDAGATAFDYAQLDELIARLPSDVPLAITEAGVRSDDAQFYGTQAFVEQSVDHLRQMHARLRPGDAIFDQVLYLKAFPSTADVYLAGQGGCEVSPKGAAMLTTYGELL